MRILISGASGFIGSNLVAALRFAQHEVVALVRERSKVGPGSFFWDPLKNHIDPAAFAGVDAIINLAGENIGGGRWSATRKKAIYESRILGTRSIVHALSQLRENVPVLISASAVGIYGDRGDEVLTEESSPGVGFLARVGMEWEGAAMGAQALGTRVVLLRFGVVLSKDGGVLKKLLPIFRIGLGGRLGSGTQYMSWIGLPDLLQIFFAALSNTSYQGAYNCVAPSPITNAEFTAELARSVGKSAPFPVPAFCLRLALGEMAQELLLASQRVMPKRLETLGFGFTVPELRNAISS